MFRARSALSSDGGFIVVHNLLNGFDRYDVHTGDLVSSYDSMVRSPDLNVVLPVLYIHDNRDLLFGNAEGQVRIIDVTSRMKQDLPHDGE